MTSTQNPDDFGPPLDQPDAEGLDDFGLADPDPSGNHTPQQTAERDREEIVDIVRAISPGAVVTAPQIADAVLRAGFVRPVETELDGMTFAEDLDARREEYRVAISEAAAVEFGAQPDAGPVFLDIADAILDAVRTVAESPSTEAHVEIGGQHMTQAQYDAARFPLLRPGIDRPAEPWEAPETRWDPDRVIPEHGAAEPIVDVYRRLDTAVRDYHDEIGTGGIVESWIVAVDITEGAKSRTGAISEKFATRAHMVGMLSEGILAVRLSGGESA